MTFGDEKMRIDQTIWYGLRLGEFKNTTGTERVKNQIKHFIQQASSFNNRDFKIPGRQRRWERQRTIVLINKNKSCTLECSVLTVCLPSSSPIRRGNSLLGFC